MTNPTIKTFSFTITCRDGRLATGDHDGRVVFPVTTRAESLGHAVAAAVRDVERTGFRVAAIDSTVEAPAPVG